MKESIVLVGGGGHCISCIDTIENEGKYRIVGIIDKEANIGKKVLGYPVLASDDKIEGLVKECHFFLITIGFARNSSLRKRAFLRIKKAGGSFPVIRSLYAACSKYSEIGDGTIIMHGAFVNALASVGENCIVNSNALVEHGVRIGAHSHVATKAVVNGDCRIGENVLLGSGSVMRQGIEICDDVIVGAGTVVVHDLREPGIYVGNPARKIK